MLIDEQGCDHESNVTDNHKHALKNMLKNGFMLSDRIVINKIIVGDIQKKCIFADFF